MPSANSYTSSFTIPEQLHVDGLAFEGNRVTVHVSTTDPRPSAPSARGLRAGFMVPTSVHWPTCRGRASR